MDTIYVTQLDLVNYLANLQFWIWVNGWVIVVCIIVGFVSFVSMVQDHVKPLIACFVIALCGVIGIFSGINAHTITAKTKNPLLNYVADKTLDSTTNEGVFVNGTYNTKPFKYNNYVVEYTDMYNVSIVQSKTTTPVEKSTPQSE